MKRLWPVHVFKTLTTNNLLGSTVRQQRQQRRNIHLRNVPLKNDVAIKH